MWCKPAQPRWSLAAYLSSVNERFKRFLKLACVRSPHTHKRLQQGPLSGDDFDRARSGQASAMPEGGGRQKWARGS